MVDWVLKINYISIYLSTILFPFTVQKYIDPSVSKVHAGSFPVSVIHQTLAWTTGSLTCIRDHSCECVYTEVRIST